MEINLHTTLVTNLNVDGVNGVYSNQVYTRSLDPSVTKQKHLNPKIVLVYDIISFCSDDFLRNTDTFYLPPPYLLVSRHRDTFSHLPPMSLFIHYNKQQDSLGKLIEKKCLQT